MRDIDSLEPHPAQASIRTHLTSRSGPGATPGHICRVRIPTSCLQFPPYDEAHSDIQSRLLNWDQALSQCPVGPTNVMCSPSEC